MSIKVSKLDRSDRKIDSDPGAMPTIPRQGEDPFLLDYEALERLASEKILRRGIGYFQENRVLDLCCDGESLSASVEGSDPEDPYSVELSRDADGELLIACSCPFDWEPACKHAVAVLLAWSASQPIAAAELAGAEGSAIARRQKRGKTEVTVRHVAGELWFGTWEARSLARVPGRHRLWTVRIHSIGERVNDCSCPDLTANRLGTCKHIEAVLHKLRKRAPRKFERLARDGGPVSLVVVEGDDAGRQELRLLCSPDATTREQAILRRHFDDEGRLRGRGPEALARFESEAALLENLRISHAARRFVRRLEEDKARRRRGRRIREDLSRHGGRMPGLKAALYDYQVDGVAFLAGNGRALLADDMGLGKTLQSIAAAVWLARHGGVRRTLIVCPASLKHQWARELRRFTEASVQIIQGDAATRREQYEAGADFTILNYELVLRDRTTLLETLPADLLIVDEAQRVKNWRTKTAEAIKSLPTRFAFVLTGTPLQNRLEDLYSVMQVVDQHRLGPLWQFRRSYHVLGERGQVLGYRNLSELRRRLEPIMLRRTRAIVRDQLPDRIDNQIDVDMTPKQRELEGGAVQIIGSLARLQQKRPLTPAEERRLLSAIQNARMACNAAGLVDKATEGAPKLDELARLLEQLCVEGDSKVVVFSEWERMTQMAEGVARGLGLGVARLHGGVPTGRRGRLIERFSTDPELRVFLSTDAGSVGLNLQSADAMILLDMPWNPAVLEQRIARVHRLGQRRPVQIIQIVSAESYELSVAGALGRKRELFENVIEEEGEEDALGLTREAALALMTAMAEDAPVESAGGRGAGDDDGEADDKTEPSGDDDNDDDDAEGSRPGGRGSGLPGVSVGGGGGGGGGAPNHSSDATFELLEESLAPQLEALQAALGARIEQVLLTAGGLLVVVDAVDELTERLAAECSEVIPTAIIDRATMAALDRLGPGSPSHTGRALFERAELEAGESTTTPATKPATRPRPESPLIALARRKLEAAEILDGQGCPAEAFGLQVAAELALIADTAGHDAAPSFAAAPRWLHGELLPAGAISASQALLLSRALAYVDAEDIPADLIEDLRDDAAAMLDRAIAAQTPTRPW